MNITTRVAWKTHINLPLNSLLSVPVCNALDYYGIRTTSDLFKFKTPEELLDLNGIGKIGLEEILRILAKEASYNGIYRK